MTIFEIFVFILFEIGGWFACAVLIVRPHSERLFPQAVSTLNERRNRLTSKRLNKLLFFQSLDDTPR